MTKQFSQFPNNRSLKFENELLLLDLNEEVKNDILFKNSQKKFTFVVYWNIWSNHFSKVILKNLKKYLTKFQMQENSLIILVNTDNVPTERIN